MLLREWRLEQEVSSGISPDTSRNERSMARFLESWHKAAGLYECRGTNGQRSQEFVKVQNYNYEHWCGVRVVRFEGHVIKKQYVQKP